MCSRLLLLYAGCGHLAQRQYMPCGQDCAHAVEPEPVVADEDQVGRVCVSCLCWLRVACAAICEDVLIRVANERRRLEGAERER